MFDVQSYLYGLLAILATAVAVWIVSVIKRDASIVDSLWAMLFLIAALVYFWTQPDTGPRAMLVIVLVALWGLRLSTYIAWRNWGEGEDFRYRQIRANNSPNFAWKSLYIVFGFQGVLAWLISLPLLGAIASPSNLNLIDFLGIALWLTGMVFESVGDFQLARFKSDPNSGNKVLDSGLWRYTRHPNYFGNACIWWGLYLIALAGGAWWSAISPLIMTGLLLKVSGVALLEKDIGDRRPAYRDYIRRTNAFIPGPPRPSP